MISLFNYNIFFPINFLPSIPQRQKSSHPGPNPNLFLLLTRQLKKHNKIRAVPRRRQSPPPVDSLIQRTLINSFLRQNLILFRHQVHQRQFAVQLFRLGVPNHVLIVVPPGPFQKHPVHKNSIFWFFFYFFVP